MTSTRFRCAARRQGYIHARRGVCSEGDVLAGFFLETLCDNRDRVGPGRKIGFGIVPAPIGDRCILGTLTRENNRDLGIGYYFSRRVSHRTEQRAVHRLS